MIFGQTTQRRSSSRTESLEAVSIETVEEATMQSHNAAALPINPLSPRPTYPTTPCQDKALSFSPFDLFSEEKIGLLRVTSPGLPFEELARILADQWTNLSDAAKTPYNNRAAEECLRQEALGAAVALTQIGTPSFRPGSSTPVALGKTARRCLEISSPDWQESLSSTMTTTPFSSASPITCTGSPGTDGGERHEASSSGGGVVNRDDLAAIPVTPTPPVGGRTLLLGGVNTSSELHAASIVDGTQEALAEGDTGAKNGKDGTTKRKRSNNQSLSAADQKKRIKSAHKKAVKAGQEIVAKMSKKDPNRPKRNQSSYMLFYTEQRNGYKRTRPGITTMDLGRALGEAWRGLSAEAKEPYTLLAKADRERYENDLCALAQNATAEAAATRSL